MSKEVKVEVEYCGSWGYGPHFQRLQTMILDEVPEVKVTGFVGRRTSFEVTVNSICIHSKLESGKFPDFKEIVQIVEDVLNGQDPRQVQKAHSQCVIA